MVILKGVTIGDNSVISVGCIIYKDVPSGSILLNRQSLLIRNNDKRNENTSYRKSQERY